MDLKKSRAGLAKKFLHCNKRQRDHVVWLLWQAKIQNNFAPQSQNGVATHYSMFEYCARQTNFVFKTEWDCCKRLSRVCPALKIGIFVNTVNMAVFVNTVNMAVFVNTVNMAVFACFNLCNVGGQKGWLPTLLKNPLFSMLKLWED